MEHHHPTMGTIWGHGVRFKRDIPRDLECPVEVYPGRATGHTNIQLHFMHRHVEDTIAVLNEGPGPHPRCKQQCDMFIPQDLITAGHLSAAMCKRRAEKICHRLSAITIQVTAGVEFQDWENILDKSDTFN